ncbi:translation initiation factor IF-2 [bacterium]|nr:translation initiation factor IF-2 [bacterium]
MTKRSPVITIMGHVDHGKTTLLDYLRRSRLTAKEQGGITQHIGAYQITVGDNKLTFIDTPGHAAFSQMRERGAQVTDIVVLVVAANDGVMPQTIESIRHIKTAGVPVVVAINKIDLPDVNVVNVKSQLAEHDIIVSDFGGDVEAVEISAKTGQGIDKLLETLVITADLLELQADPQSEFEAVVIESLKDQRRGPVANIIVRSGTLQIRQDIYTSQTSGKVKGILNDFGKPVTKLLPGEPGQIIGFKSVPSVGAIITSVPQEQQEVTTTAAVDNDTPWANIDFSVLQGDKKLRFILKADTQGTLEAIATNCDPESVELIAQGVGEVTDTDVELARTAGAKILSFQVKVSPHIMSVAKAQGVKIKSYDIIYELIEYIQKKMLKLLEPTIDEVVTGVAVIQEVFVMKGLRIAGVKVNSGELKKNDKYHLKRDQVILADPVISSMMHGKLEVDHLKSPTEGGITFRQKKLDFQVGDVLTAYEVED